MLEMGGELPSQRKPEWQTNSPKCAIHHGTEGSQRGHTQENRQEMLELGGELTLPETIPHGNLKHTTFDQRRATKIKELGGGEKNTKFKPKITPPKNEVNRQLKK